MLRSRDISTTWASHEARSFATGSAQPAPSFRFSESLPVVHATIPGKECVPIIASYAYQTAGTMRYISGGVSIATRAASRTTPTINATKALGARKPFAADLGGGTAGNAVRAHPALEGTRVTFRNAPAARPTASTGGGKLGTPRAAAQARDHEDERAAPKMTACRKHR